MGKASFAVAALLLTGLAPNFQGQKQNPPNAPPAEFKVPPEEARRRNPVEPTANSIAEGKRLAGLDCAVCHGKEGDGKGELSAEMKVSMLDWRDPSALKDRTDGELFYMILKGKEEMPGEEGRLKAKQIWDIVNFVRSLARKGPLPPAQGRKAVAATSA